MRKPPSDWPPEPPTTKRILEVRCPACATVKPRAGWCCVLCRDAGFVTPEQKAEWQRLK